MAMRPWGDLLDPRANSLDHPRDEGFVATVPLDERAPRRRAHRRRGLFADDIVR